MVVTRPKRYRDSVQAHYTACTPIVAFMSSRLVPEDTDFIWEPCAGNGDLIDGVLSLAPNAVVRASELDAEAVEALAEKYQDGNVDVRREDALEVGSNPLFEHNISFSRIIANPPYGAYMTPQRRKQLQSQFPNLYVRDTYGVLLFHAINLLSRAGRLVFIIPDTFLWLNRHEFLRRRIILNTTVEEIALFPSKFFPNISFGYSGLCIITLTNAAPSKWHEFNVLTDFPNVDSLLECVERRSDEWTCSIGRVKQRDIASRSQCELLVPKDAVRLGGRATETLGDHADLKTGFYSGNEIRWVRRRDATTPRSKKYQDVNSEQICGDIPSLDGIDGNRCFVPIVRGGASAYSKPTHWYVNWSSDAVSEYRRKGQNPARFQNSAYYFRDGIGVPMVASSRLTGALLENRLFDQGIVGIFPANPDLLFYLLGFVNSSIATELIRRINPTANNSANYMKRLPFVVPTSAELSEISPVIELALRQSRTLDTIADNVRADIDSFYERLWRE